MQAAGQGGSRSWQEAGRVMGWLMVIKRRGLQDGLVSDAGCRMGCLVTLARRWPQDGPVSYAGKMLPTGLATYDAA